MFEALRLQKKLGQSRSGGGRESKRTARCRVTHVRANDTARQQQLRPVETSEQRTRGGQISMCPGRANGSRGPRPEWRARVASSSQRSRCEQIGVAQSRQFRPKDASVALCWPTATGPMIGGRTRLVPHAMPGAARLESLVSSQRSQSIQRRETPCCRAGQGYKS